MVLCGIFAEPLRVEHIFIKGDLMAQALCRSEG